LDRIRDLLKNQDNENESLKPTVMNVVSDPSYSKTKWIVTGHSLGGGVAEVFTNLVNKQQIACGISKISRCVTFAPAPGIVRECSSCFSKEIYTMYINGNDPVVRMNGDNLKDWAFDQVQEHSEPYGDFKQSWVF